MVGIGGTVGTIAIPDTVIGVGDFIPGRGNANCMGDTNWFDLALFLGCTAAAWIAGFGTGYQKGARDAVKEQILKAAPHSIASRHQLMSTRTAGKTFNTVLAIKTARQDRRDHPGTRLAEHRRKLLPA
jgi:hypothetical protein